MAPAASRRMHYVSERITLAVRTEDRCYRLACVALRHLTLNIRKVVLLLFPLLGTVAMLLLDNMNIHLLRPLSGTRALILLRVWNVRPRTCLLICFRFMCSANISHCASALPVVCVLDWASPGFIGASASALVARIQITGAVCSGAVFVSFSAR